MNIETSTEDLNLLKIMLDKELGDTRGERGAYIAGHDLPSGGVSCGRIAQYNSI